MQLPSKHFPAMGVLTLVLVGAAAGSIYYYQFVTPHDKTCATPVHRVIFLEAIVQESGGFRITRAATLNGTGAPLPTAANYTSSDPNLNFTRVILSNYTFSGKAIQANVGDTITVFMYAVNGSIPPQDVAVPPAQGLGHGFGIDGYSIPSQLRLVTWETWGSTTFEVKQPINTNYRCLHQCSPRHGEMTGSLVVSGCA